MTLQELFSDPTHWTQGYYAMTKPAHIADAVSELYCEPFSPLATCWCLDGGIQRCYGTPHDPWTPHAYAVKDQLAHALQRSTPGWNDDVARTAADVLDLVTREHV